VRNILHIHIFRGKPGVVGYAEDPRYDSILYLAEYMPDMEGNASIICKIFSSYPLERGTLNLLKTVHIELPSDQTISK
jgi:hypothetical protein